VSLLIGITGGNHVLHRSLIEACEKAGHRSVVADARPGHRPNPAVARAQPRRATGDDGPVDVMIVIDSSLLPREDGNPAAPDMPGAQLFNTRRTILATSNGRADDMAMDEHTVVVRTTPVYGITTDPITRFLIMMRSLPVVPVLTGTGPIQPIWQEDLAAVLVRACTLSWPAEPRVIDDAGPESVTADD
jgi:hypothetical protein